LVLFVNGFNYQGFESSGIGCIFQNLLPRRNWYIHCGYISIEGDFDWRSCVAKIAKANCNETVAEVVAY